MSASPAVSRLTGPALTDVLFSEDAEHDLFQIYLHLFEVRRGFGENANDASLAAEARVMKIRRAVSSLLRRTNRIGTRRDDVLPGLRFVPVDRSVAYFRVEGDRVEVFGVFRRGQDHHGKMDERLLG